MSRKKIETFILSPKNISDSKDVFLQLLGGYSNSTSEVLESTTTSFVNFDIDSVYLSCLFERNNLKVQSCYEHVKTTMAQSEISIFDTGSGLMDYKTIDIQGKYSLNPFSWFAWGKGVDQGFWSLYVMKTNIHSDGWLFIPKNGA